MIAKTQKSPAMCRAFLFRRALTRSMRDNDPRNYRQWPS
jgi:hypothetical protein